jgi:hydrogenase maturation protease
MISEPQTLLVGIGSPFGDDQAGWLIARTVAAKSFANVTVRCARSPAEMLDWVAPNCRLIVCDACHVAGDVGVWHCWQWPSEELPNMVFSGTHDLGLLYVLQLAQQLGRLSLPVTIWGIEVADVPPLANMESEELSPQVARAVELVATQLAQELHHARVFAS